MITTGIILEGKSYNLSDLFLSIFARFENLENAVEEIDDDLAEFEMKLSLLSEHVSAMEGRTADIESSDLSSLSDSSTSLD